MSASTVKLLKLVLTACVLVALVCVIAYVIHLIKNIVYKARGCEEYYFSPIRFMKNITEKMSKRGKTIFIVMACVGLVFGILDATNYKDDQIGSIFESSFEDAPYYVYAYPNKNGDKCYKLEAEICRREGRYYIYKMHFGNGGSQLFECDYELTLNEKEYAESTKGEDWWIVLTDEKVK